jgi:hypothetical protein
MAIALTAAVRPHNLRHDDAAQSYGSASRGLPPPNYVPQNVRYAPKFGGAGAA